MGSKARTVIEKDIVIKDGHDVPKEDFTLADVRAAMMLLAANDVKKVDPLALYCTCYKKGIPYDPDCEYHNGSFGSAAARLGFRRSDGARLVRR